MEVSSFSLRFLDETVWGGDHIRYKFNSEGEARRIASKCQYYKNGLVKHQLYANHLLTIGFVLIAFECLNW